MKKVIILLALVLGIKVNAQIVGGFMPPNSSKSFTVGNTRVNGTLIVTGVTTLSNISVGATTLTSLNVTGPTTLTGAVNTTSAITSPTIYGGSTAASTLYLRGSSSATPGVVSIGSSTGSNFVVSGSSTLTGQTKQTNTLNLEGNTTWNTNQTNTLTTGNSGTVAVLSDALFSLSFEPNTFNPADATTYYFGNTQIDPKGNSSNGKVTLPYNCILVKWDYNAVANGLSSTSETATISINGTTNYTLSTGITYTAAYNNYTTTAISQNFNAGDVINIKEVFPTFATNPVDVYQGLTLWFVRRQ